eukprot:CAMPEP_0201281946 /NCGR_PEP_ID=MMETSP1317-20130820/4463_1 /ASSEMBLY_ACC=CAM_ASM_000770 /TAXON_ID=187299 /ORGANISM="Undescribed Undescribed, Strain Undescribed" /LENGTH=51 /DNA_ID=CAMNT_0047593319 /DNA_START=35 /DNA_END=190 /DNA_ORIENTATION=+
MMKCTLAVFNLILIALGIASIIVATEIALNNDLLKAIDDADDDLTHDVDLR